VALFGEEGVIGRPITVYPKNRATKTPPGFCMKDHHSAS
jgi:hypothetical protein